MSIVLKAKKAISYNRLVGDTVFSDAEYEELRNRTRTISKNFLDSKNSDHIKSHDRDHNFEIIFVTLVEITKRWGNIDDNETNESGFWDYVIKTILGSTWSNTNHNKIYREYRNIIDNLKDNLASAKKGDKYYTTLMMHAFSPIKSIYAFLDLSYNIFKKDLNFNYTENDKDFCNRVTLRFCEILENSVGDDKSISIGTNSYAVKIGLRTLARESETQDDFIDLLNEAFININLLFYDQSFNPQSYFEVLVNRWWQEKKAGIKSDRKDSRKSTPAVPKNKIDALNVKFIRDDKIVYLVIPPIRLDNNVSSSFYLSVFLNGSHEPYTSELLSTIKGEFFETTKQKEIDLNALPLENGQIKIQIEIKENNKIVYNKNIVKEFILFEKEAEVLRKIIKINNYFFYSKDKISLTKLENISTYASNLYNIYPEAGEWLAVNEQRVYFIDKTSVENNKHNINLIGEISSCVWVCENKRYSVFNNHVVILIPNYIQIKGLELNVGSKKVLLSELETMNEENYHLFNVTKLIPENEPLNISIYSHLKEKQLLEKSIVIFHALNIKFSKFFYYGNDEKKLTISFGDKNEDLNWNNRQDELIHIFLNGELVIKIPYIKWRINNKEWHNESIGKKLWYKSNFHIGSILEIDANFDIDRIFVDNHPLGIDWLDKNNENFKIGNFIYSNENNKEMVFFFRIMDGNYELFSVFTEEYFKVTPLKYEESESKLYWCTSDSFFGDEDRKFKLEIFRNNNELVYSSEHSTNDVEIKDINDGVYSYIISSPEKNLFKDDKIFIKSKITVGRKEKFHFENKYIQLTHASNDNSKKHWNDFSKKYYIDKIEFIEQDKQIYYLGHLYAIGNDEKKYMDKMKNEKNEGEIINPIRIDIQSDNTIELSAGYNKEDQCCNIGKLFYDIDKRVICNYNPSNRNERCRYRCIDYYRFKEVKNV